MVEGIITGHHRTFGRPVLIDNDGIFVKESLDLAHVREMQRFSAGPNSVNGWTSEVNLFQDLLHSTQHARNDTQEGCDGIGRELPGNSQRVHCLHWWKQYCAASRDKRPNDITY